jgi:hypothetical protein
VATCLTILERVRFGLVGLLRSEHEVKLFSPAAAATPGGSISRWSDNAIGLYAVMAVPSMSAIPPWLPSDMTARWIAVRGTPDAVIGLKKTGRCQLSSCEVMFATA